MKIVDLEIFVNYILKEMAEDFFLVELKIDNDNKIDIRIDRKEGNIKIEDCIILNKKIHEQFEEEVSEYELNVSSAGITSNMIVKEQFEKNVGKEVEILLRSGIKIEGILIEYEDENIKIEKKPKKKDIETEIISANIKELKYCRLILKF